MDENQSKAPDDHRADSQTPLPASQCIDWYAEGESRIIESNGVRIIVRFIGRKGRRGRIMITAPPGTIFRSSEIETVS